MREGVATLAVSVLLAGAAYAAPPAAAPPATAPPAAATATDAAQLAALRQEVSRLKAELDAERAALTPAPPVMDAGATGAANPGPGWARLIAAAAVALLAGFALGWRVLDRLIRRKYGGLRIY